VRSHPLDGVLVAFYRPAKGRKHLNVQHQPSKSSVSRKHAKREQEPWLLVVSPSLKAFSAARVVAYYRSRMQIEEGLRDTKSTHYGLDFTSESRIEAERRANLLLIAALIIFALWLTVEIYAKPEAWQKLGSDDFNELAQNLACLPTELVDKDEEDKRFDMLVLRAQLAILQARPNFTSLRKKYRRLPAPWKNRKPFRPSRRKCR